MKDSNYQSPWASGNKPKSPLGYHSLNRSLNITRGIQIIQSIAIILIGMALIRHQKSHSTGFDDSRVSNLEVKMEKAITIDQLQTQILTKHTTAIDGMQNTQNNFLNILTMQTNLIKSKTK